MSEFIQIGSTALRDPVTGDFLPLYIGAEDREACETAVIDGDVLQKELAKKFAAYKRAEKEAKVS